MAIEKENLEELRQAIESLDKLSSIQVQLINSQEQLIDTYQCLIEMEDNLIGSLESIKELLEKSEK